VILSSKSKGEQTTPLEQGMASIEDGPHRSLWAAVARQNQDFSSDMKPFASSFASICLAEDVQDLESAKFGLTMQDGVVKEEREARRILEPYRVQGEGDQDQSITLKSMRWPLHPLQVG